MAATTTTIGVRCDAALLARIDAVAKRSGERASIPVPLDRATVLRGLAMRVLPQVEAELGIVPAAPTPAEEPAALPVAAPAVAAPAQVHAPAAPPSAAAPAVDRPAPAPPPADDPEAVRAAVRRLTEGGVTQATIERAAGVATGRVSRFLADKLGPDATANVAAKIAAALPALAAEHASVEHGAPAAAPAVDPGPNGRGGGIVAEGLRRHSPRAAKTVGKGRHGGKES